jgi:[NiFe] hydrogenase assembly HybE family chaperone
MNETLARLVAAYQRIGAEQMQGLPMFNSRLQVEAVGFREWEGRFLGILIAPWFMNLVVLPTLREDWQSGGVGSEVDLDLPSGSYSFHLCLADEVGVHLSLALFSAVGDFPDQETARSVAEETLCGLFTAPKRPASDSAGGLTRRALLSGTPK